MYEAAVVKLGMAPSEFWAMSFPELVAMLNMHAKAQRQSGGKTGAKMTQAEVDKTVAWLNGEAE